MKKLFTLICSSVAVFPLLVYGAVTPPTNFKGLVGIIANLIGTLILLVFSLTFIVFMWGIIKAWIIQGGDTEGVESGKKIVLTGVIVLVIMTSIWGILQLLKSGLFG